MSNLADAMKQARAGSLARRPAIANAGPASSPNQGGEFEGRTRMGGAVILTIDRIVRDENQPRQTFDDEKLGQLAANIKVRGQLVPILVRWDVEADRYVIIDGERRYRASRLAGMPTMACVIEDQSDPDQILELQLITNALREDVAPVEQAKAWDKLMRSQGLTQQQLADKLGYERSTISKAFDLLTLSPAVQARVDAGEIPASTAGEIGKRLDPDDQQAVVDQVVAQGLSRARAVEVADKVARSRKATKGQGGKAKPRTIRVFKGQGGYRVTVERAKGIEPAAMLESLRALTVIIEAEIEVS